MVGVLSSGSNGLGHSIRVHQYSLAGDIIEEAPCRIVQFGIPYRTSQDYCLFFRTSKSNGLRRLHKPPVSCYFWTTLHRGNPVLSLDIGNTLTVGLTNGGVESIVRITFNRSFSRTCASLRKGDEVFEVIRNLKSPCIFFRSFA